MQHVEFPERLSRTTCVRYELLALRPLPLQCGVEKLVSIHLGAVAIEASKRGQQVYYVDISDYSVNRLFLEATQPFEQIMKFLAVSVIVAGQFISYGSPIFTAVPKKRCKALYRALKKSPKSPELAVGAGSEPSYVDRSVGAP